MSLSSCDNLPPMPPMDAEAWVMTQPDTRQAVMESLQDKGRIVTLPDGRLCGKRLAKAAERQIAYDAAITAAGAPAIKVAAAAAAIGVTTRQIRNQIDGATELLHVPSMWEIRHGIIIHRLGK